MDQQELPGFLETAAELRVKGLSEADAGRVSMSSVKPRSLDLAGIEVMGGVAPEQNKTQRKTKGGTNVNKFKKEVEEVDYNIRESGHPVLKIRYRGYHCRGTKGNWGDRRV